MSTVREPTPIEIEEMVVAMFGVPTENLAPDDRGDARNDARTAILVARNELT